MKNEDAVNDVRRKVAERLKKDDAKIIVGMSPKKERIEYKEGDVWEDSMGKKWTVKNGVKQSVTKLDTAKTPFWCPKCSKPLNHKFDVKFWRIRGHCMDCQAKYESKIRQMGKWEEYEKSVMLSNYIAQLKDTIAELKHNYDAVSDLSVIHADDTNILMVERWNVDSETVKKHIQDDIDLLTKRLEETIAEHGTGEFNVQVEL
jgi:transcription elongation factor Elf1